MEQRGEEKTRAPLLDIAVNISFDVLTYIIFKNFSGYSHMLPETKWDYPSTV